MGLFRARGAKHAAAGYSVIDDRMTVRGEIDTDGTVRVDGRVEGPKHHAGTLIVGARGGVVGDVEAGNIVVAGGIHGNVHATGCIEIEPGAVVHGEIRANAMVLQAGATVHGQLSIGAAPSEDDDLSPGPRLELADSASASGRVRR